MEEEYEFHGDSFRVIEKALADRWQHERNLYRIQDFRIRNLHKLNFRGSRLYIVAAGGRAAGFVGPTKDEYLSFISERAKEYGKRAGAIADLHSDCLNDFMTAENDSHAL